MGLEVLHLILCDRVETDPDNYHRCNIFGLITSIRSAAVPQFPVVHPQLVAFLVWTGGQGTGELMLRIVEDRSTNAIFQTRPRPVRFVGDPASVGGFFYRIRNCRFPAAGLCWIEVLFDGSVIARNGHLLNMKNPSPNPDPTIPVSLDYIFELTDDGNQPEGAEAEVIVIPPFPPAADGGPPSSSQPNQKPQT